LNKVRMEPSCFIEKREMSSAVLFGHLGKGKPLG